MSSRVTRRGSARTFAAICIAAALALFGGLTGSSAGARPACGRAHAKPAHCSSTQAVQTARRAAARRRRQEIRERRQRRRALHVPTSTQGSPIALPAPSAPSPPSESSSGETAGSPTETSPQQPSETPSGETSQPREEAEQPAEERQPEGGGTESNFRPGLVSGTNMHEDLQGAMLLGAKLVRVGVSIATTVAELEPVIAGYAAKGIRVQPLAEFYDRVPTAAEAKNLANWARTFGPGGSFWVGRAGTPLPLEAIEFGNETASKSQYGDSPGSPSFMARAETYAVRFKEAAEAIAASGEHVGLLAQDEDDSGEWMKGMYTAVPQLTQYVAGWTIHPYGGEQYNRERLEALIHQTAQHGGAAIPIDLTEWGVATDNGNCVNFNEGFNVCMSYEEAAGVLRSTVNWIGKMLGKRLGDFFLYQVRDQQPHDVSSNCQAYYGVLQHELQPKGAYTTAAEELLRS